jgi:uridine kinase
LVFGQLTVAPISIDSKKASIPVYSFKEHQRQKETTPLYSPRVLILEGILALLDPRIAEMLDVKVFVLVQKSIHGDF